MVGDTDALLASQQTQPQSDSDYPGFRLGVGEIYIAQWHVSRTCVFSPTHAKRKAKRTFKFLSNWKCLLF